LLVSTLLYSVLIPGVIAFAIALVGRRTEIALALAIFAATVAGSWSVVGRPELVPDDISRWLGHLALLGAVAAIASSILRGSERRVWAVRVIAALGASYLVLRPILAHRWGLPTGLVVVGGAAATLVVYGGALDQVLRRTSPRVGITVALVSMATSAATVAASGSLTIAQIGGGAAAGVGAVWVLALVRPAPAPSLAYVVAPISWAVVAIGMLYAAMPWHVAVLALSAPLVACLGLFAPRSGLRAAIPVGLALAIAGVSVRLAVAPPPVEDEAEYGY
jgi:hypothetical protein